MNNNLIAKFYNGYMSDIPIEAGCEKIIDEQRKKIYAYDKSYLVDSGEIVDPENISKLSNGRFTIKYKNVNFPVVFNKKEGENLIVVLSGYRSMAYPEFKRWSWYPFFQGSMLNIADPMLGDFPDLHLGWYWGNNDINYRQLIAEIVIKVADFLNVSKQHIILYGSSGGGCSYSANSCLDRWVYRYCY